MTAIGRSLALAGAIALAGCAASGPCDSRWSGSPQFDATSCRFRNMVNPELPLSQPPWKIWTRFLFQDKVGTVPVDPLPVRRIDAAALAGLDPAAVHVIRLGHSSHLLKLRGAYWLIDPVFGERASPFSFAGPKRFHAPPLALAELPPIEGLILSHDHYDHLDKEALAALRERVGRWFVPLGVGERLTSLGIAVDRIEELDWWQQARHGAVGLTATPAQHFSGRTLWDRNTTLWASWVIESGDQRVFFSGDSGYFPGFREIGERFGGFDLALLENGAYDNYWPAVHMTPEQTIAAALDLRAKLIYGVHNSTFDLAFHPWQEPMERLADLAEGRRLALVSPLVGEVLTLGRVQPTARWWRGLR
jgi:L-ascorbate metabolism protein UlaG (beta-lactamase superfamily)